MVKRKLPLRGTVMNSWLKLISNNLKTPRTHTKGKSEVRVFSECTNSMSPNRFLSSSSSLLSNYYFLMTGLCCLLNIEYLMMWSQATSFKQLQVWKCQCFIFHSLLASLLQTGIINHSHWNYCWQSTTVGSRDAMVSANLKIIMRNIQNQTQTQNHNRNRNRNRQNRNWIHNLRICNPCRSRVFHNRAFHSRAFRNRIHGDAFCASGGASDNNTGSICLCGNIHTRLWHWLPIRLSCLPSAQLRFLSSRHPSRALQGRRLHKPRKGKARTKLCRNLSCLRR